MLLALVLIPLSLFIGIAASAIGFTAWPLIVPLLFVLCGFDLYLTLFSSLLVDFGNALVMTTIAARHRQVDFRCGLMLAGFALAWIIGGFVTGTALIPGHENFFRGTTGFVTVLIGIIFIIKGIKNKSFTDGQGGDPPQSGKTPRRNLVYAGVAMMAFLIGSTGVGGGMGFAISLMLFLSFPVLKATGTAMLMTACATLFAAGLMLFQIPANAFSASNAQMLIPMMVGLSMLGTMGGAKIAYSMTERQINFLIGTVVIVAGLLATLQKYILIAVSR